MFKLAALSNITFKPKIVHILQEKKLTVTYSTPLLKFPEILLMLSNNLTANNVRSSNETTPNRLANSRDALHMHVCLCISSNCISGGEGMRGAVHVEDRVFDSRQTC